MVRDGVELVDVDGSFQRLLKETPKIAREVMKDAIKRTAFAVAQRVKSAAPVGPDAPHIRDAVEITQRGLMAQVGYLSNSPAVNGQAIPSQAAVALYNEYHPNQQPFMRPSAKAESSDFLRRSAEAIRGIERQLAVSRYQ